MNRSKLVLLNFTHLDANGEGMGQRTERGYVFAINMLMRPALMIMSFFVASGLLIALGTLLAKLFLPAIANVQGNSMTGIATIAGMLIVFFMMNVMMIHALFNLVYIIPDQVLGMIGGHNGVHLGKDADDRIRSGVYMAVKSSPSVGARGLAGAAGGRGAGGRNGGGGGAAPGGAPKTSDTGQSTAKTNG